MDVNMNSGTIAGRKIAVYKLGGTYVSIGGLKFHIHHRIVVVDGDEDHGASIDVYASIDGRETELIKFDCFKKGPHYHAPATSRPIDLDAEEVGDGVDWVLGVIRDGMPEMLASAGYADLARTIDRELFVEHWIDVRDAVVATTPASYDVPAPG